MNERKGSVTLYIRAHGHDLFDSNIERINQNVYLVSFAGNPGLPGWMTLCPDGDPVDLKVLYEIGDFYHRKSLLDPKPTQKDILYDEELTDQLKLIYKDCLGDDPTVNLPIFSRTQPTTNRFYSLKPNPNEHRELSPEYGITVVASTNEEDAPYTLESRMDRSSDLTRPSRLANININPKAFNHWMSKCKLTPESNFHIRQNLLVKKTIYLSNIIVFFRSMGFKNILIWDTSCRTGPYKGRSTSLNRLGRGELTEQPPNTPARLPPPARGVIMDQPEDRRDLLSDYDEADEVCNSSNGFCDRITKAAKDCYRGICGKDKIDGGRTRKNKRKNNKKNKIKNKTRKIKRKTKKNKTRKLKTRKLIKRKLIKRI